MLWQLLSVFNIACNVAFIFYAIFNKVVVREIIDLGTWTCFVGFLLPAEVALFFFFFFLRNVESSGCQV